MIYVRNAARAAAGLALVLSLALGGATVAQDATPATTSAAHPAHIHEGTCDNLNPAPLYPLDDVVVPDGTTSAGGSESGAPIAVETSSTTVDAPLADIVGGNLAINVHESAENIQNYIACGEIGGAPIPGSDSDATSQLAVGLRELNGSGYSGVAVLRETGAQTEVTIYLAQGLSGPTAATPESNHAGHEASAAALQVDIIEFAYNPDPLTVSVGQSVTWTNRDAAPHTVTAPDRDVLQSGTLQQGDTFTATFDTPGTYEYFCEFHAGMQGSVIVE